MNQSKKTPEEAMRSAILKALVDGGHTINSQEVRLFADPHQDGNALHQVTERIVSAALAASSVVQTEAVASGWHWVFYEGLSKKEWVPAVREGNHWNSASFRGIPHHQVIVGAALTHSPLPQVDALDGWFLPLKDIEHMRSSFEKLYAHAKRANLTDATVRKDGKETVYEADWIKHLVPVGAAMKQGSN